MSDKPCPDCEVHNEKVQLLTEAKKDIDFQCKETKENKRQIEKIYGVLDGKVSYGSFIILLTALITVFLFILGSQLSLHQKVSDLSIEIKTTFYEKLEMDKFFKPYKKHTYKKDGE